jgi:hypothetical protein
MSDIIFTDKQLSVSAFTTIIHAPIPTGPMRTQDKQTSLRCR